LHSTDSRAGPYWLKMSTNELLDQLPGATTYGAAATIALDADFDARWNAWAARGKAHEQLLRGKLVVLAGVLAAGAVIVYAFIR
jgi:hypothetical protein